MTKDPVRRRAQCRAAQQRYELTAKGRAAKLRYERSAKGKAVKRRYGATPKGARANQRRNAKKIRIGQRYVGYVRDEGLAQQINAHVKERLSAFKQGFQRDPQAEEAAARAARL